MNMGIRRMLVAALLVTGSLQAAERAVDYAAEDAAVEALKALKVAQAKAGRIAVLPLSDDTENLYPVVRAELASYPGLYEFYTRNEAEWDTLLSEIEFADRRGDVMDATTIQKFGRIKGVEALLYGSVREASVDARGNGVVRLSLTLSEVETGRQLWSGNITGQYAPVREASGAVLKAVINAAGQAAENLSGMKSRLGNLDIYLMPVVSDGVDYSDFVRAELSSVQDDNLHIYNDLSQRKGSKLAMNLAREFQRGDVPVSELTGMVKGLGLAEGAASRQQALMLIRFGHIEEKESIHLTEASLNFQLVNLNTGMDLWAVNVQGSSVDKIKFLPWVLTWKKPILIGLGVLVVLGLVSGMFKGLTRPR